MATDISSQLSASDIQLEQQALSKFGAVVDDFNQQMSDSISATTDQYTPGVTNANQSIAGTPSAGTANSNGSSWTSLQYAADLISLAPKHRFLFKVHFHFNAPYVGDRDQTKFSYLIKSISRPKVSFEYTDINMYNFRTKVLTNIKHEPITLDFYDDIGNNVQEFFNTYRRAYSPISRTNLESAAAQFENSGMDFDSPNPYTVTGGEFSASMGQLVNGAINILNYIELEQYFAHGTQMNVFKFINPRAESFDFDESTVDGGDLHSMKVSFNYDALIIDTHSTNGTIKDSFGMNDIMSNTQPWSTNVNSAPIIKPSGRSNSASSFDILQGGPSTGMIIQKDNDAIISQPEASVQRTLFGAGTNVDQSSAGLDNLSGDEPTTGDW